MYDWKTASRVVTEVVVAYIFRLMRTYPLQEMEDPEKIYRQRLKLLGCDDEYIDSAMKYARDSARLIA